MTVFVNFVMGKKEVYFFNSPTHWAWHNLPPDVENLFTKQPPIKDILELALGDNGTYFVSYRDHDGQIACRHYNLPNPLTTYLYNSQPQVIRDLTTLSITLGPYESYYAHDKTSASWSNLPSSLEKAVLARLETQDAWRTVWKDSGYDAPSFVNLGADGSYFMRTVSGGGSWDLKSKEEGMRGINKFLEDSSHFGGVAGLYLFPHYPDSYILLLTSGKAFSNLPEHTWTDYNKMAPALPALVQTSSPIPPVPQMMKQQQFQPTSPQPPVQPQLQYQQPTQVQQHQPGCCPPTFGTAHNCCPQAPTPPAPRQEHILPHRELKPHMNLNAIGRGVGMVAGSISAGLTTHQSYISPNAAVVSPQPNGYSSGSVPGSPAPSYQVAMSGASGPAVVDGAVYAPTEQAGGVVVAQGTGTGVVMSTGGAHITGGAHGTGGATSTGGNQGTGAPLV